MTIVFTLTEPDREEDWVFTFGCGQKHAGHYVVIPGKLLDARAKMFEAFGTEWCHHYPSKEAAGVEGETEIDLEGKEVPK